MALLGLNEIEASAFDAPLGAAQKQDGGAVGYCIVSIAISLKRIADSLEATDYQGRRVTFMDVLDRIAYK